MSHLFHEMNTRESHYAVPFDTFRPNSTSCMGSSCETIPFEVAVLAYGCSTWLDVSSVSTGSFSNPRHTTVCIDGFSMRQFGRTKGMSTLGKDSVVVGFSLLWR